MTSVWMQIVVENWRRRKWLILFLLLVLIIISALGIVPWGYVRSDAIQGRIVDAESGQPIPRAIITMNWPQMLGTLGGTIYVGGGVVKRIETFSDEMGRYYIPAWKRPKPEIGKGGFSKNRPDMHIYAAGYWPRTLRNKKAGRLGWGEAWKAEWDGEDIELEPMHWREWSREEWEKNLRGEWDIDINGKIHAWGSSMHLLPKGCEWKKRPKDTVETIQYNLKKISMFPNIYSVVPRKKYPDDWSICPDTKEVLLEHGLTREEWEICLTGKGRKYIPARKGKTIYRNTPKETIQLPPLDPSRTQKFYVKPILRKPVTLPGNTRPGHNMEGE